MTHVRTSAMVRTMAENERLLTSAEAARKLGIRKRTLLRRVETGQIPFVRKLHEPNGAYLFEPSVIDYLARQAQTGANAS